MDDKNIIVKFEKANSQVNDARYKANSAINTIKELYSDDTEIVNILTTMIEGIKTSSQIKIINDLTLALIHHDNIQFADILDSDNTEEMDKYLVECIVDEKDRKVFVYNHGATRSAHETSMIDCGYHAIHVLHYINGKIQVEFAPHKGSKLKPVNTGLVAPEIAEM